MNKLIMLALFVLVIVGCTQNTPQNNAASNNTNVTLTNNNTLNASGSSNLTISAAAISSDLENVFSEVNNFDVNNTGDAIIPLTETDLNTD